MSDLKLSCVLIYLDDINVFSCTFKDHLVHLEEVSIRLRKASLELKAKKCHFFKDNLEFLGFHILKDSIRPVAAKVEAIERMKRLENMRDIHVFWDC